MCRNVLRKLPTRDISMSSGRSVKRKSNCDDDDSLTCSWTHIPQSHEMLSSSVVLCGVNDSERATPSSDKRFALDPDVEADALMSCAANERRCQPGALRTKDDTSSGLQETVSTTESTCYMETSEGGWRTTTGDTVMLTSRGTSGRPSWNNTVVLPADDQRTRQLSATSSQVRF